MATSFGGTVKLTGESEYRKALKDIIYRKLFFWKFILYNMKRYDLVAEYSGKLFVKV